jgi:hypothetical protein
MVPANPLIIGIHLALNYRGGFGIEEIVAFMVLTTEHEQEVDSSIRSVACFQGANLCRTIIVID